MTTLLDRCPVCDSPFTAYVRDVPTRRTKREIKLFTCLSCRSFWNPSGYKEDTVQLERDLAWGISVEKRNIGAANRLFDALIQAGVAISSVAEIGCGIGTLLSVAKTRGYSVIGYDTNDLATKYARDVNHINSFTDMWTSETTTPNVDLYLSISVLEHIERPRSLIENLCKAALKRKAALFISVPFISEQKWNYILDPDPHKLGTPFFDNDVHVTHFSADGLISAMRSFRLQELTFLSTGLWEGILYRPELLS